ncbi:DUF3592 domain-containing protein [Burkholderia anthina]|uniref:DUF3592 domain-containing protein n=1 Tax=Burkholderia anthina TaxID=179879 RepID=UPI00158A1E72|nr:DUF3592 domain-containing protein [Burkholderia anthina]
MNDKSKPDGDDIANVDARRSVSTTGYAQRVAGQRKARRTSTRKPADMAATGATRASVRRRVNVFLLIGVALLLSAAVWVYTSISAASHMTETEAVVVGFSHDGYDVGHYRTVYRFVTASGEAVEVKGRLATTSPSADPGDRDRLYYDPAHPADGVIFAGFFERWFGVGILTILGTVFAGIGVLVGRDGSSSTEPEQAAGHASDAKPQSEAMSMMGGLALVAGLPLLLGTGLLGGAGALYVHNQKQVRDYIHTTGQVVEMAERKRSDRGAGSMDSAIVTFRTDTGRTVTFAQGSSSSDTLNAGDTVRVLYDPRNPDRAVVRSFGEQWGAILILCAIGLPFVAVGVGFGGCAALDAWRYRRKKRKVH